MYISRIQIHNFRNFSEIDVNVGEHAVIVGENKIGKSNLMYALRLLLDPSLPDSARRLRTEDFWDGLTRPLCRNDYISISVDLSDFEDNANLLAILSEHIIQPEPMVARLTYVWRPLPGLDNEPRKDADYEFILYGGDRPENRFGYDVRRRVPMELMPALRDCEGDLTRWTRSPLRPLLDKAAEDIDQHDLEELAQGVDNSTEQLTNMERVRSVAESITEKLTEMVGASQASAMILRFAPTDASKLIRALRIFIDGGRRVVSDASLGSTNLLYFALKSLEYEQLVEDGERDHTFIAIEEPEAHLHPNLQRLIFRNYLHSRGEEHEEIVSVRTVLMTTHSPHIASVTPLKGFILLRHNEDRNATVAVSTATLELNDEEMADLERYIDVNRAEFLFARGVILVEGDAEKFLVPVLAGNQGFDLDELGISVCSISGTNFYPYLALLGPMGLNLPVAALTDADPRKPKKDGTARDPLGPNRIVNQMMKALVNSEKWDEVSFSDLLAEAPSMGMLMNEYTFEIDLFNGGLHNEFGEAMDDIAITDQMRERMRAWVEDPDSLDIDTFLADVEAVGKGRLAQRLASIIKKSGIDVCPMYIIEGVRYVAERCSTG